MESGSWDQGSVAPHEGEDLRGLSVVGVAETRHCRVPGALGTGLGVGRGREPGLAPPPVRDPPPGLARGQTPTEIWRRRPWGSAVGWSGKQLSTASVPGSPVAQRRPERRRRGTGFSALLPPLRSKLWHSHSLVPQIRVRSACSVSDGAAGSKCPAADAGRRSTGTHTQFLPRLCTAGAQGAPGGPGGPHLTPGAGPSRQLTSAAGGLSPVEETPVQRGRRPQTPGAQGQDSRSRGLRRPGPSTEDPFAALTRLPAGSAPPGPELGRHGLPGSTRLRSRAATASPLGAGSRTLPVKAEVRRPIARGLVLLQLRRTRRGKQKEVPAYST